MELQLRSMSTSLPQNLRDSRAREWIAAILMKTAGSCPAIALNFPTALQSPQNKIISGIKSVIQAIMQLVCNTNDKSDLKM